MPFPPSGVPFPSSQLPSWPLWPSSSMGSSLELCFMEGVSLSTLPTRWVSAPPVSPHRNNSVDLPLGPTFLHLNCSFSYLSSLPRLVLLDSSGYTGIYLPSWKFGPLYSQRWVNSTVLPEVGDTISGREWRMHSSQTKLKPPNTVRSTLSDKQLLRT